MILQPLLDVFGSMCRSTILLENPVYSSSVHGSITVSKTSRRYISLLIFAPWSIKTNGALSEAVIPPKTITDAGFWALVARWRLSETADVPIAQILSFWWLTAASIVKSFSSVKRTRRYCLLASRFFYSRSISFGQPFILAIGRQRLAFLYFIREQCKIIFDNSLCYCRRNGQLCSHFSEEPPRVAYKTTSDLLDTSWCYCSLRVTTLRHLSATPPDSLKRFTVRWMSRMQILLFFRVSKISLCSIFLRYITLRSSVERTPSKILYVIQGSEK